MKRTRFGWWFALGLMPAAAALAPGSPPTVVMSVNRSLTSPISPYIYGMNFAESSRIWGRDAPRGITLNRMGGNRLSAYNWETNASNCGNDCNGTFQNDDYLGGPPTSPAAAVQSRMSWSLRRNVAFLATVPMLGHVAADADGKVPLHLPLNERRRSRFFESRARKDGGFSAMPDGKDRVVYQDEFVNALVRVRGSPRDGPAGAVWFSLDNEPDLWGSTHEAVRGNRTGTADYVLTGYDELAGLSVEYARAIKDVAPWTLVFGPVLSNWNGMANLFHNRTRDPAGNQFFLAYYLDRMRKAESAHGRRLLDVLDVHWYPESTTRRGQSIGNEWAPQDDAMVEARVQSPRSLWDGNYVERSWVTRAVGGPVRLLPRLKELIAQHYPGTRVAITEYFFHRGGDISGALAQADALGVFGREGVFAAALWPQGSLWAYQGDASRTYACTFAAFASFLDFDGEGGRFGDVSIHAETSDWESTSFYASKRSGRPGEIVMVAINKQTSPVQALINLGATEAYGSVRVWRLTGTVGQCTGPIRAPDLVAGNGTFSITLPPLSVSTLVAGAP